MLKVIKRVFEIATPLGAALLGCFLLCGCQTFAQVAAQQRAERAQLRNELSMLTPVQKSRAEQCSSLALGRVRALRMAGEWQYTYGENEYSLIAACIRNPYYFETIPRPTMVAVPQSPSYCTMQQYGDSTQMQCNQYP